MELLSIEPQELKFPFELKKPLSCSLQLWNRTDSYVAFKVKTTYPKKYCVRPNIGVVLPHSICDIIVTMQGQREAPPDLQCKDKFLLQSFVATNGATTKDVNPEMFNKESGNLVEECKLRVIYVSPPQLSSPEGSEEDVSPRASLTDNGNLNSSDFSPATTLISRLTEEKNSTVQQTNNLRQELVVIMPPEVELDELEKHFYKDHNIVDEGIDENAEPKNKLCDIQLVGDILEVRKLDGPEAIARKDDDLEAIVGEFVKDFQYEELETATRNFSNKLGSGGSGQVFKGILKDGTSVAVKRVEREVYGKYEFFSELSAITSAQHFNLVRLRGYCSHVSKTGRIFFIVYDFFKNGSLDSWIFPNGQFLSWKERCKVALDVAKALVYLHRDCRKQILHLDLKPENILVGDDFRGVLSDFGMSKLMSKDESSFHTEMTRGTRGYMAPEWNSGYRKEKSVDIFSYGKVLMDMFLGQRNVCFDRKGKDIYIEGGNTPLEQRKSLLYVKKKLDEKKVLDLIDKRLTKDRSIDERLASCFVKVALQCLKEDPRKRPCDMWEVLTMLEPILKVLPDDKKEEHDDEEEEEEEED